MATLTSLAARLLRLADNLDDVIARRKERIANAVIRELIMSTPADTSKALSNWRVSTGDVQAAIGPIYPGEGGSTQAASAGAAIAAAEAAIRAGRYSHALVIFNSVSYIRRLNEGSSAQAPAGFVERAILVGRLAARR